MIHADRCRGWRPCILGLQTGSEHAQVPPSCGPLLGNNVPLMPIAQCDILPANAPIFLNSPLANYNMSSINNIHASLPFCYNRMKIIRENISYCFKQTHGATLYFTKRFDNKKIHSPRISWSRDAFSCLQRDATPTGSRTRCPRTP